MTTQLLYTGDAPLAPEAHPRTPDTLPGRLQRRRAALTGRMRAARKRSGSAVTRFIRCAAAALPDKYTWSQLLGGASALAGTYVLWGLGVGLLAGGLAVVAASVTLERSS